MIDLSAFGPPPRYGSPDVPAATTRPLCVLEGRVMADDKHGPREVTHAVEAYGVGIDVRVRHRCDPGFCPDPDLNEMVRALLPPGSVTRRSGRAATARFSITCATNRLTVEAASQAASAAEGEMVHSSASAPDALHALDGAMRTAIALAAPGLVFVHAGAVAVDGRAIVLPGHSMAGKTTLVAALVEAGATYLSDEYAPLDADGLVHPYPRRLSIRAPEGRHEAPVGDLGGRSATEPLPVAVVASITYRHDATWSARPTDVGSGALALIANAVAAQTRPNEVLHAAGTTARGADHLAGERGKADAAAEALIEVLAAL